MIASETRVIISQPFESEIFPGWYMTDSLVRGGADSLFAHIKEFFPYVQLNTTALKQKCRCGWNEITVVAGESQVNFARCDFGLERVVAAWS